MKISAKMLLLLAVAAVLSPSQLRAQAWGNRMQNNPYGGNAGPSRPLFPPAPPPRPNSNSNNTDAAIVKGIFGIVDTLIKSGNSNNKPPQYVPQRPTYQQPQYYTQPQYTPQPTVVTSVAPAPVAPKNEIVTTKKKPVHTPVKNSSVAIQLGPTQAETDARQELEAGGSIGMLDVDVEGIISSLPDNYPNKKEIVDGWKDVMRNAGSKEDVEKFLNTFGPKPVGNGSLPAGVVDDLRYRQKLAYYKDAVRDGVLTADQKDAALRDIRISHEKFAVGKNATAMRQLEMKITNMENYNTLGKLAIASQYSDNPYPILLQGANQMQMPTMFVSELTGYPVMSVEPISNQTAGSGSATIVIDNPISNGQSVRYMLKTYSYTMEPGTHQKLDRAYTITFDPASGSPQKRYSLTDGYYVWSTNPKTGWELQKTPVKIEIDNSRYNGVFNYLLNGERMQVAAGEIAEHSSAVPLEVVFNAGRDKAEHRKLLNPGRYIVGLNPEQGALDLFDSAKVDAAEEKEPPYQASTTIGGSNATQAQRVQALLGQFKPVNGRNDAQQGSAKAVSPVGRPKVSAASVEDLLKSIKQPD